MVGYPECRRVHDQMIGREHIKNNSPFPPFPTTTRDNGVYRA
jgi:hypothetical protein